MRLSCVSLALFCMALPALPRLIVAPSAEYRSVAAALAKAQQGDTVLVENGTYREQVALNPGVVLKARNRHKAILDGKGRGNVVTLSHGSAVVGMLIRNGSIGIVSSAANTRIEQCRVEKNAQSGIMCVGHLPDMVDNLIVYNGGSGIQGWDLRSTNAAISHNTIAFNANHGVALGGSSDVIIENCIIAFNGQFGVKSEEGTIAARVLTSNLYRNGADVAALGEGCISQDPRFADARRFDFSLDSTSACIRAAEDNTDLGARLSVH